MKLNHTLLSAIIAPNMCLEYALSMFHLSAMKRRINFQTFFSLTVDCENELLKTDCVLRLQPQKFISLKLHHPQRL